MPRPVAFLLALLLSLPAAAEGLPSLDAARALTDAVMADIDAGKVRAGLARMRSHIDTPVAEFDSQIGQVESQMPMIRERYGGPAGHEFLGAERVGDSLAQYVYLQKYRRHFMVWRFTFYRASDEWVVNGWSYDDRAEPLFAD